MNVSVIKKIKLNNYFIKKTMTGIVRACMAMNVHI